MVSAYTIAMSNRLIGSVLTCTRTNHVPSGVVSTCRLLHRPVAPPPPRALSNSDDEPDWEQEIRIFKQRTLRPAQLETLRKLEEQQVDVGRVSGRPGYKPLRRHHCRCWPSFSFSATGFGQSGDPTTSSSIQHMLICLVDQVLYCKDSLAIVEGLNNDAEVGTALSFSSGARG